MARQYNRRGLLVFGRGVEAVPRNGEYVMLPEIVEELCVRDDVVGVRFPGEKRSWADLEETKSRVYVQAVLNAAASADVRFLVLDLRNFECITGWFISVCLLIWKRLRHNGQELVIMCGESVHQVFEITKVNRILRMVWCEDDLREWIGGQADVPFVVTGKTTV